MLAARRTGRCTAARNATTLRATRTARIMRGHHLTGTRCRTTGRAIRSVFGRRSGAAWWIPFRNVWLGTLWILDEMVRLEIISSVQAMATLKSMCEQGSRLPQDECDRRLQSWQKDTR